MPTKSVIPPNNKGSAALDTTRLWISLFQRSLLAETDERGRSVTLSKRLELLVRWSGKCSCDVCNTPGEFRFIESEAASWIKTLDQLKVQSAKDAQVWKMFKHCMSLMCKRSDVQAAPSIKKYADTYLHALRSKTSSI